MDRYLVGVSGGIDSLFCAIILKKQGFDVYAVHLHLHSKEKMGEKAEDLLKQHGINLYYVDYTKEFKQYVVEYFTKEYAKGYTPNPCVICNRDIKLPMLFKEAKRIKADRIATGHYADIDEQGFIKKHKSNKDQSYFLACVDKEILKHTVFPLKGYDKETIKKHLSLTTKESSDLCFIKNNYRELLKKRLGVMKGKIVKGNTTVGYHSGFYNYTIGQRKGMQIGNKPHYVVSIDAKRNIVYAGEEEKLYSNEFFLDNPKILTDKKILESGEVECLVRYRASPKKCKILREENRVILIDKERAVTPGQVAVFYHKDKVVACGRITNGIH